MVTWEPVSSRHGQLQPAMLTSAVHLDPTNPGGNLVWIFVCDFAHLACFLFSAGQGWSSSAPVCPSTGTGTSLNPQKQRTFASATFVCCQIASAWHLPMLNWVHFHIVA